jgi:hypothetical protein
VSRERVFAWAASVSAIESQREALAGAPGAAFASRFVVAGAEASPGGEVTGGGEDAHVGAGLGDDHFGGAPLHTGDRAEQLNRRRERADLLLDRLGEQADLLVEEVDVGEDRADHDPVLGVEAALERLPERRQLLAQLALRELGEHGRVGRTSAERVEHRPPGGAENVGRDAVELDAGVLEDLVQPVGLALALADLRLRMSRAPWIFGGGPGVMVTRLRR